MQEQTRRRVGLMGGTFDPIHIGHLMLAECAYEQFQLEQVLFLPAGNPPHKDKRKVGATDRQRIDMVRLAIEGNPHFALDPEQMLRECKSCTRATMKQLTRQHPDTDYYFIIGADSLMAFDTWHHPEEICRDSILAVAVRDQISQQMIQEKMHELEKRFQARIYLLQTPDVDIASRRLRQMRSQKRSIRYYVTDPVWQYIEEHALYQ